MTADFLEYFYTDKYDGKVLFKDLLQSYTVKKVKELLGSDICGEDNFAFILKYLKNVISDPDYKLEFRTSGTCGEKKSTLKSLENLTNESLDIFEELKLGGDLEFITTTSPEHLFGTTFYMMYPLNFGHVINTSKINYPEDIKVENAVLVTTPSFLESMRKYESKPPVFPKVIITAGAKLEDETFRYAKEISERVIEIYGSTEAGIIAYRETPDSKKFKLFRGIEILSSKEGEVKLSTNYSLKNLQTMSDNLKINGREIEYLGRSDRIIKIHEKRISAEDLEKRICEDRLIKDCYCFEQNRKIASAIVLTPEGQDYIIKNGAVEFSKKLKSFLQEKFEVVPQRWVFLDEIPKTESGKISKDEISRIFNTNLTFPLILGRNYEDNSVTFRLCFLRNSNFFQGHFENFPILPGVVQLYWANYFTKLVFGIDCTSGQIRRIKFSNMIFPDKEVCLRLTQKENGVEFKYFKDELSYSSGNLPRINVLEI